MAASGTRFPGGTGYDSAQNKAMGAGGGRPDLRPQRIAAQHPPFDSGTRGEGWDTAQNRAAMAEGNPVAGQEMEGGDGEGEVPFDPQRTFRDAWSASTTFMEAGISQQWEKNLRNWQGKHPKGSKYASDDYRARSKLFRPKTRAAVRKGEAACAAAFFSTVEVVNFTANDARNPLQRAAASLAKSLVQYRLTRTVPWFLTCVGAFQDAQVLGVCVSRQRWDYQERVSTRKQLRPVIEQGVDESGQPTQLPALDEEGMPRFEEVEAEHVEILVDKPVIDLIPPENVRIDPGADWRDPINSSPYLIVRWPLYVTDVKARMKSRDGKTTMPKWRQLDDATLAKARATSDDQTRRAREAPRPDSRENASTITDFDTVWCNEVIVRVDGKDWHYWTLGEDGELLSEEIVPLGEVYLHDERPFAMGIGVIETHRVFPSSKVQLGEDLQAEANEVANQRLDNVKLAMNGRTFVRRGGDVDLQALMRSTPGGAVLMNSPEQDVKLDRPPDVTASSFAEQDRIDVALDDIHGNFSGQSVQTNRQLNETVGGMQLLAGNANAIGEYDLRVFAETWVERVMRQIAHLEQAYETDATILAIAAEDAKIVKELEAEVSPELLDHLLAEDVMVQANVGIGATDPMQRLGQLRAAVDMTGMVFGPAARQWVKPQEMLSEIWGRAGVKDGTRFFKLDEEEGMPDPRLQQAQEIIQKLQDELMKAKSGEAVQMRKVAVDAAVAKARLALDALIREQELDIKRREAGGNIAVQREKTQADVTLRREQRDAEMRTRRHEKLIDTYAQAGLLADQGEGEEPGDPLQNIVGAVVPRVEAAMQQMTRQIQQALGGVDQRLGEMADQIAALSDQVEAPREVVRDAAGRPVGVRVGNTTRAVVRDASGQIVGLQ